MKNLYPTPHINATPDDFAKTVLMPGDPLRAKFISESFLENAVLVNNVRGICGYTGEYKGKKISVMASGMGMPSIGIYAHELYNVFGVENIIRVGSAGAMQQNLNVYDIVIAQGACTNSAFVNAFNINGTYSAISDYSLLKIATQTADALDIKYSVGNLLSSDNFYSKQSIQPWIDMGVLAVEMEAAALFITAAAAHKKALAICTISDHLTKDQITTSEEREQNFTQMITLSLETAIRL